MPSRRAIQRRYPTGLSRLVATVFAWLASSLVFAASLGLVAIQLTGSLDAGMNREAVAEVIESDLEIPSESDGGSDALEEEALGMPALPPRTGARRIERTEGRWPIAPSPSSAILSVLTRPPV
jgi:hypothetical protein